MTDEQLLAQCKIGINIPESSTAFDDVLNQKLLAVKGFMAGAGVASAVMENDLAVGVIVMGVTDLWNNQSGETKFSPVFHTLLNQLAIESLKLKLSSSSPADGATNIAVIIQPTLTFNQRVESFDIALIQVISEDEIGCTIDLDLSKKIITIEPYNNLEAGTEYAIVINEVSSESGPQLGYSVIRFTTST